MTDLARICADLGYRNPRTLLASGNVVFDADGPPGAIEQALEAALATHGLVTDVIVRDLSELRAAIAANPFPEAAADHPSHLLVTFHRDPFPADALARLAAMHPGPERLHAVGRELFSDFLTREGMRESKLLQGMAKAKFPKVATARNWNTLGKLAELLA